MTSSTEQRRHEEWLRFSSAADDFIQLVEKRGLVRMSTLRKRAADVEPGDMIVDAGGHIATVRSRAMRLTAARFMVELEAVERNEASYVTFSVDDMVNVRPAMPARTDEALARLLLDLIRSQDIYVQVGDPLTGQEIDGHVDLVALARGLRAWLRDVNL